MKTIILNGIPGSGKSTYAKSIPNALIVSADDYFIHTDGSYNFDPSKLFIAQSSCQRKFEKAIKDNVETIIIDNTNLKSQDVRSYYNISLQADRDIEIVKFICDPEVCYKRGLHSVPLEKIKKMYEIFLKPFPPEDWECTLIEINTNK